MKGALKTRNYPTHTNNSQWTKINLFQHASIGLNAYKIRVTKMSSVRKLQGQLNEITEQF